MASLYELTQDFETVINMLYTDVDEQTIFDTLESIEGEIEDKADGYAKVIRGIESDISGLKSEEKRIKERRQALENRISLMKKSLEEAMRTTGRVKFKTSLFSFGIQKNPVSVEITDEAKALGSCYVKQKTEIDKTAIKEAIQNGEQLDFAQLVQSESLRIR